MALILRSSGDVSTRRRAPVKASYKSINFDNISDMPTEDSGYCSVNQMLQITRKCLSLPG